MDTSPDHISPCSHMHVRGNYEWLTLHSQRDLIKNIPAKIMAAKIFPHNLRSWNDFFPEILYVVRSHKIFGKTWIAKSWLIDLSRSLKFFGKTRLAKS